MGMIVSSGQNLTAEGNVYRTAGSLLSLLPGHIMAVVTDTHMNYEFEWAGVCA